MKDYTKQLLVLTALIIAAIIYTIVSNRKDIFSEDKAEPDEKITNYVLIDSIMDERGLISVQFIDENKDTVALDYITNKEFDSLFNNK